MEMFWIIIIMQAIVCGWLSMNIAERKGYSPEKWFACGFFFGFLGLIGAAGLPQGNNQQSSDSSARYKICPDCAEQIQRAAKICRYCRYSFDNEHLSDKPLTISNEKLLEDNQWMCRSGHLNDGDNKECDSCYDKKPEGWICSAHIGALRGGTCCHVNPFNYDQCESCGCPRA